MYRTRAQRSVSGRCRHAGMAPRPVVIFQNNSPSVSSWTRFEVQSAGFGLSATAAGPSPLPTAPWQATQLSLAIFSPCSTVFLSLGSGLFLAFSGAGATHGVWALATEGPSTPPPAASSRTAVTVNPPVRASEANIGASRTYRPSMLTNRIQPAMGALPCRSAYSFRVSGVLAPGPVKLGSGVAAGGGTWARAGPLNARPAAPEPSHASSSSGISLTIGERA